MALLQMLSALQRFALTVLKHEADCASSVRSLRRLFEAFVPPNSRTEAPAGAGSVPGERDAASSSSGEEEDDLEGGIANGKSREREQIEVLNLNAVDVATAVLDALCANATFLKQMTTNAPLALPIEVPQPISSLMPVVDDAMREEQRDVCEDAVRAELAQLACVLLILQIRFGLGADPRGQRLPSPAQTNILVLLTSAYGATLSQTDVAILRAILILDARLHALATRAADTDSWAGDGSQSLWEGPIAEGGFLWGETAAARHANSKSSDGVAVGASRNDATDKRIPPNRSGSWEGEGLIENGYRRVIVQHPPVDPVRAIWTCVHFPEDRALASLWNPEEHRQCAAAARACYDPAYVLPFCVTSLRAKSVAPSMFCRWGLLALCFRALAGADAQIRYGGVRYADTTIFLSLLLRVQL